MKKRSLYVASSILGLALVGCSKSDQPASSTPPANTPSATATPATPAPGGAQMPSMDAVKQGVANATAGAKQEAANATAADPTNASGMLDTVEADIKRAKLSHPDTARRKVGAVKVNLPQNLQDRVTQLRADIDK